MVKTSESHVFVRESGAVIYCVNCGDEMAYRKGSKMKLAMWEALKQEYRGRHAACKPGQETDGSLEV